MIEPLLCGGCCLKVHQTLPFHRLKKWTGKFFDSSSLDDVGFLLHMGHGGTMCPSYHLDEVEEEWTPSDVNNQPDILVNDAQDDNLLLGSKWSKQQLPPASSQLVCVDISGIHCRQVKWCICPNAPDHNIQLFQMRLFSSSIRRPSTVFTFNVLDEFHIEAMECKTTAFNFYTKLRRMSNNAFPSSIPVSFNFNLKANDLTYTRTDIEN